MPAWAMKTENREPARLDTNAHQEEKRISRWEFFEYECNFSRTGSDDEGRTTGASIPASVAEPVLEATSGGIGLY